MRDRLWLFLLNFIILQWFFIRLAEIVDENSAVDGRNTHIGWTIIKVLPFTGWCIGPDYMYWGRRKS